MDRIQQAYDLLFKEAKERYGAGTCHPDFKACFYSVHILLSTMVGDGMRKYELNEDESDEELGPELCPECGSLIVNKMSGVKCSKCDWWLCL